jgi:hypothetical protein
MMVVVDLQRPWNMISLKQDRGGVAERGTNDVSLAGLRLHFVGIGGCGMSGLARIARQAEAFCTGSDIADSSAIADLRRDGFEVALEQSSRSVPGDCDWLVISAAIPAEHPEVVEARRRGLRVVKYAQLLGRRHAWQEFHHQPAEPCAHSGGVGSIVHRRRDVSPDWRRVPRGPIRPARGRGLRI